MRVSFLGKLSLMAASAFFCAGVSAADITGAGATFPYPVYAKWAEAYKAKTGTRLNYQAIGSGGGIKQIKAKTVDFGASPGVSDLGQSRTAAAGAFLREFRSSTDPETDAGGGAAGRADL